MNEFLKYNLQAFGLQTKKLSIYHPLFILLFALMFGFCIYCFSLDTYKMTSTNAQVVCEEDCNLFFYTSSFDSDQVAFVKVNQKKYFDSSFSLEEPFLDEYNQAVQKVTLNLKEFQGKNNEIVTVKIFKDKEKLIKRLFKIITER